MPDISITDFTDFVLRTGPPKITKVQEIFNRGEYHPSHDFWKPLRDNICEYHEGETSRLTFSSTGAHERKRSRYEDAIEGYKKFLSRNQPEYFKPHRAEWKFEDLSVRVNPEVGFALDDSPFLVKLYFKQEPLTKTRVQVSLALMASAQKSKRYKVAILDVVRARLHSQSSVTPQMVALLEGEAATFLAIWNSLS